MAAVEREQPSAQLRGPWSRRFELSGQFTEDCERREMARPDRPAQKARSGGPASGEWAKTGCLIIAYPHPLSVNFSGSILGSRIRARQLFPLAA